MSRFTFVLALTLLSLMANTGRAQVTRDAAGSGRSAFDLSIVGGVRVARIPETLEQPFVVVQSRLTQHIARLSSDLALEFDLDGALVAENQDDASGVMRSLWFGSPWLGLGVASRTPSQTLRLSLGAAAPLAGMRGIPWESISAAGMGGWSAWLMERGVLPFGVQGLAEWRFAHLDVGAEAALVVAPSLPGAETAFRVSAVFGWAAAGLWLTGHLTPEVDLGARLQAIARIVHTDAMDTTPAMERTGAHASLTPFVRYWFSRGVQGRPSPSPMPAFFEFRVHFNFVAPEGPALFADNYTWALAFALGTTW